MITDVLCARDFSPASERAFGYALEMAERTGATLHLMYVEEVALGLFSGDPSPAPGEQKLQRQFEERCREDLPDRGAPDEDRLSLTTTRSGAVAPALVTYATKNEIDLLVMGTQGRRGVKRAVFGSVAEEVLRTAPCPVLTTRAPDAVDDPEDDPADDAEADAEDDVEAAAEAAEADVNDAEAEAGEGADDAPPRPAPIDQVVAPIDFSDPSREALQYAARLASTYDVPLTLVHVVSLPNVPAVYGIKFEDQVELISRARTELRSWKDDLVPPEQDARCIVTPGNAVSSILSAASTPGDLLVMATRGLSGVKRAMLGSVAEGVLREAPGPVLTSRSFPEG